MKGIPGKMHSKFLLVGPYLIVGSTNWTSSSKGNHETSVLIFLNKEGYWAMRRRWDRLVQASLCRLCGQEGLDHLAMLGSRAQFSGPGALWEHPPELVADRVSVNREVPPRAGVGAFPPVAVSTLPPPPPARDRYADYTTPTDEEPLSGLFNCRTPMGGRVVRSRQLGQRGSGRNVSAG